MTKKTTVLKGDMFGQLTVLEEIFGTRQRKFKLVCSCGSETSTFLGNLSKGHTKSCGCLIIKTLKERAKHGKYRSKVYKAWQEMRDRCNNPNKHNYCDYGGRGIKVCARWDESFINFYEDVGEPPSKQHSIERLDVDGDYRPNNVVWAEQSIQNRNRRMFKSNLSGVTGVSLKQRNGITYYTAIWMNLDSTEGRKCFSGNKYGDELAMFLATEYREQQINLLNLMGAGYSDKHGL